MINKIIGEFYLKYFSSNRLERIWKLAQIDFKKRYYNDKLGMFWALLNPILQVILYYLVFEIVISRGVEDFALFLFVGLIFWTSFMIATKQGMNIFRIKKYLIENIQFKRIDLFFSHCISVFLGFIFSLAAYIIVAFFYGVELNILRTVIALPLLITIMFILIFGCTMVLSTLAMTLRDVNHIWDFSLLCGFWTAGIFFPASEIIEKLPIIQYLNPFLGIIENARRILMLNQPLDNYLLSINIIQASITVLLGLFVFYKFSDRALEKL